MGAFDKFDIKEKLIRKTIEIDSTLYGKLQELSDTTYDASVNKLVNACIEELLKSENVKMYIKAERYSTEKHSLLIRESLCVGLDNLKDKYGISIYKLVNMAISNAIEH